jgi:hypothetical protein
MTLVNPSLPAGRSILNEVILLYITRRSDMCVGIHEWDAVQRLHENSHYHHAKETLTSRGDYGQLEMLIFTVVRWLAHHRTMPPHRYHWVTVLVFRGCSVPSRINDQLS